MKSKSFMIYATIGILAASLSYITPAMAEDDNSSNPAVSNSTTDNNMNMPLGQDNSMSNAGSTDTSTTGSDEGSPDTATGDDDY